MKHLKQKLMAAVSMLMVSFLMLTSASYAWFTISVTPEVKSITTTVQANENFEIALGTTDGTEPGETDHDDGKDAEGKTQTDKDQTWGATVTSLTELKGLGPAELGTLEGATKATINAALYGTDGRPAGLAALTSGGTMADGVETLVDGEGHVVCQKVLLWLRSNTVGNVKVEVSGVDFGTETDSDKVQVAFQWGTNGNITAVGDADTSGVRKIDVLGAITDGENGNVNTAIPVYVYIYLEGDNVTNEDVAEEMDVVIESIKFTNSNVDAANAYKQGNATTGLNPNGNTAPATTTTGGGTTTE